ncbi:MAG TPA: SGNH/GDSL hydrolase family protein [Lacunisphaera sp.]|nr:SGNH/GDSL hydrolase family protein [Lacunisphaera sp.]
MNLLSAADPLFRYEGRFDRADPAAPVVIWAGSRIRVDFEGEKLAVVFGPATGQAFFNVSVDGATEIADGARGRFAWPQPLKPGRHQLEIFKRSEADAGHVAFRGVELAAGAKALAPAAPGYRLKIEFIGDSITVGANNEDGAVDQWEDRRTHNHALSYGCLTSAAFRADHRAMAVSGMGICEGFVPMVAGDTWYKVYPRENPARADLASWLPDLVCINLGENDSAFTRVNHRPFPPGFTAGYVALVRAVRAAYPAAQIVLLRGGMWSGKNDPALREAWDAAVKEIEATDRKVSHFVFQHWSEQHPRVGDHRAMADELTGWLKQQAFMATWK